MSITALPKALSTRYHNWKTSTYERDKPFIQKLAIEGQKPQYLVISCCDSRVQSTQIFGANTGDFFLHRNIANLVPPYQLGDTYHGTAAVIEYGVTALGVRNILVLGHTQCGGIKGCHAMCAGNAPELEKPDSFVGRWMELLRPAYEQVISQIKDETEQIPALERQGVLTSLNNLMSFPYVRDRVNADQLSLHGAIFNIHDGTLEHYDPDVAAFVAL